MVARREKSPPSWSYSLPLPFGGSGALQVQSLGEIGSAPTKRQATRRDSRNTDVKTKIVELGLVVVVIVYLPK